MNSLISGLHHVTALASNPQKNVDFYRGILGLRLIKKTINFDAPDVYHLYFGNEKGTPGTLITFFPFSDIPKGVKGTGQVVTISFSISSKSLPFWMKRLESFNISYKGPFKRFSEEVLYFEDYDGLQLELVANDQDNRVGFTNENIPFEFGIKGFFSITLSEKHYEKTAKLLIDEMEHQLVLQEDNLFRFSVTGKPGGFVDILHNAEMPVGILGYGSVHHVAFATKTNIDQMKAREKLLQYGLNVTPIIDREYFHSIYFREPGGVLFEIATEGPGFTVDEPLKDLGKSLKLPPWQEKNRSKIEKILPPIT